MLVASPLGYNWNDVGMMLDDDATRYGVVVDHFSVCWVCMLVCCDAMFRYYLLFNLSGF